MKSVWKYIIAVTVGLIVLTSVFVPVYLFVWKDTDDDKYIQHEPIIIWNDSDFSEYGLPGRGTKNDPYRIENYNITTSDLYAIYIFGTIDYFVIENCYLESSNEDGYGIYIEGVNKGTAKIYNNTLSNCYHGIGVFYTDAHQIIDNKITCCVVPFNLENSKETTIFRNTISNPESEAKLDPSELSWGHSRILFCAGITFSQNTVQWTGLLLDLAIYFSENLTFVDNDFQNVELSFSVCSNSTIENNLSRGRVVNLFSSTNIIVNGNDFSSLNVVDSPYSIITNNYLSHFSIDFDYLDDYYTCTIENNWVNDKLMSFYIGLNNTYFTTSISEYGQMVFVGCNNITLSNPTLFDQILHLDFLYCEYISVQDLDLQLYLEFESTDYIEIENNNILGFQFESSNNVTIENNSILDPSANIMGGNNYTIANNEISNLKYGLYSYCFINEVQNLLMYGNRIFDCEYSLTMYELSNSVIFNNTFENVTRGLRQAWLSNNVTISNNTIINSLYGGITLHGTNETAYLSLTFENNYVDGKLIGYYVNLDNVTVDTGNYAHVFFVNCTGLTVKDLTFSNVFAGLSVLYCNQTTISNITVSHSVLGIEVSECSIVYLANNTCSNSSTGIDVEYSSLVYLENNTCRENENGIEIYQSANCTLEWNTLINNSESGIFLYSSVYCNITYNLLEDNYYWGIEMDCYDSFNKIYNNAFINNNWQEEEEWYTSQAFDVDPSNMWYNEITLMGNYWDDWISGTYELDYYSGVSRNSDPYPLISNPL